MPNHDRKFADGKSSGIHSFQLGVEYKYSNEEGCSSASSISGNHLHSGQQDKHSQGVQPIKLRNSQFTKSQGGISIVRMKVLQVLDERQPDINSNVH